MSVINRFHTAVLSQINVAAYYRNTAYPNFDSFVFLQVINPNTTAGENDYSLIVYAAGAGGAIIAGPLESVPLPFSVPDNYYDAPAGTVIFSSYHVGNSFLKKLYPNPTVDSDLTMVPDGSYNGYVLYDAGTNDLDKEKNAITQPIKPSPPYPPGFSKKEK